MSYEWTHAPHIHEYNGKRVYAFIDVNPLETNSYLVRKEGLEPTRPFGHQILNLARLPVPPLSRPLGNYLFLQEVTSHLAIALSLTLS